MWGVEAGCEGCAKTPGGASQGLWGPWAPGVTSPWNYVHAAEMCSSRGELELMG